MDDLVDLKWIEFSFSMKNYLVPEIIKLRKNKPQKKMQQISRSKKKIEKFKIRWRYMPSGTYRGKFNKDRCAAAPTRVNLEQKHLQWYLHG